jgi:hypothetical protein
MSNQSYYDGERNVLSMAQHILDVRHQIANHND